MEGRGGRSRKDDLRRPRATAGRGRKDYKQEVKDKDYDRNAPMYDNPSSAYAPMHERRHREDRDRDRGYGRAVEVFERTARQEVPVRRPEPMETSAVRLDRQAQVQILNRPKGYGDAPRSEVSEVPVSRPVSRPSEAPMPERRSTRHETTSRSSREKSGGAKKDVKEKRPTGQAFTRCRFMDDEWRICGDEVSPWLLETHDFLVVATLGAQKVGRSTVLSTLLSPFFHADGPSAANFQVPLGIHTAESFLEGQSSPGVDMCITMDRLLLLDAQPLFESSADLPSELCLMIFLASICHCILVVTDTALDPELWRFLRLLATLKAKVPDLASWLKTQANEASTPKEAFPHLLVVFNNMEEDEELHEPMEDFLKYTAWKAAPSIRCVTVPHLPGLSAEEMLCSAQAAELGRSLRQELFHEGSAAPGGFGGLQLTEKQWLNHLLEYWDFVQKRSEIQSYFDLPMAGRLKSLDSPDPKS